MKNLGKAFLMLPILAALSGCSYFPPSTKTQTDEVTRLAAQVVPVVNELRVHRYLDEGWSCSAILYAHGDYRDGRDCGSPTEGYRPFDARIRGDFDRISAAIDASHVGTRRFEASYTAEGRLEFISFRRRDSNIEWNWQYLYDPHGAVAKTSEPGHPAYTQITESWWLVTEVDD